MWYIYLYKMKVRMAGFLLIILLSIFSSCGDLGGLIPPRGTYDVKATLNGSTLEDFSLIRAGDEILPYFSASVVNDQDLTDLSFYLLNSRGEIAGEKVMIPLSNQEIKPFSLPETLEIGFYTLVFEALSEDIILSRSEMDFFYISDIKFDLNDIKVYLPSVSGSQSIAPKTTVLLEAELDFESILDPYLVWRNEKNIIAEGKYNEGLNRILWTAPDQAGFYSISLDVFPYRLSRIVNGITRSITLAISPKTTGYGFYFTEDADFKPQSTLSAGTVFPEEFAEVSALIEEYGDREDLDLPELPLPPVLLQWYQFGGNLYDSLEPFDLWSTDENSIESHNTVRWAPAGKGYGLSVGKGDSYQLSSVKLIEKDKDEGGGVFLFLIRPIDEGKIFSAFFPSQTSQNEGLTMELEKKGYDMVLHLSNRNGITEMPLFLSSNHFNNPIPVIVEFYFNQDRFEAKLSVQDTSIKDILGSIRLLNDLSGECNIKLDGGPEDTELEEIKPEPSETIIQMLEDQSFDEYAIIEIEDTVIETTIIKEPSYTVWCEFAVLYSALPLIKENVFFIAETEIEETEEEEIEEEEEQEQEQKEEQEPVESSTGGSNDEASISGLEVDEAEETEAETKEIVELPVNEDDQEEFHEEQEIQAEVFIDIGIELP